MTGNFGREFVETVALRESTIASGYPHSESDCEGLFTTNQQVEQLRAVATLDGPVPQIPPVVLLVAKREIYMRLLTRILTTSRWCRTARIRGGRFRASPCASCVIGTVRTSATRQACAVWSARHERCTSMECHFLLHCSFSNSKEGEKRVGGLEPQRVLVLSQLDATIENTLMWHL